MNNPAKPTDCIQIEVTFEVYETVVDDVEWEIAFVATDGKEENDQILDSLLIGPIREGLHKFQVEAPAPDLTRLRPEDFNDVTVLQLRCKYHDQMFCKISWFVTHSYTDPELCENPPERPRIEMLSRKIHTDDLRNTTFPIKWGEKAEQEDEKDDKTLVVQDETLKTESGAAPSHSKDATEVVKESVNETTQHIEKVKISEETTDDQAPLDPLMDMTNN